MEENYVLLLICLTVYFFFFLLLLRASLHSFPPHRRLDHSSLPTRGQVRDLKVGWNFYRQVCLYGYKFHVENKLKKKQHKYVVVKGVGRWINKEINCRGYLSLSLIDDWIVLPEYQPKRGGDLGWGKLFRFKCGIKNYFQLAKTNLRIQFNCNKIW